jgi:hypothetical protein
MQSDDGSDDWSTLSGDSGSPIPKQPFSFFTNLSGSSFSVDGSDEKTKAFSFPKFQCLPRELRIYIWELICPEFATATQTLEFIVQAMPNNTLYYTVYDAASLRYSTRRTRRVLAVHRESRAIATQTLTDTLTFRASRDPSIEGLVRFKQGRDLIFLKEFAPLRGPTTPVLYHLPNFAGCVQNVAVERRSIDKADRRCATFLAELSKLKKVFYCQTASSGVRLKTSSWKWFTSNACHQKRRYFGNRTSIYCWPKLDREPEIANIPRKVERCALTLNRYAEIYEWKLLPMVAFKGQHGVRQYEQLVITELDHGAESGSHTNEYDSSHSSYSYSTTYSEASTSSLRRSPAAEQRWRHERRLRWWLADQQAEQRRVEARRAERRAAWRERRAAQQALLVERLLASLELTWQ